MNAHLLTSLTDWSRDVLFHAVPAASWAAYVWLKEWQTLVAAILVIFAARYFFHATLRASRIMAEAAIRSARIAASAAVRQEVLDATSMVDEAPSALASRHEPVMPEGFLNEGVSTAAPSRAPLERVTHVSPKNAPERKLLMRLDILRSTVRSALAAIPTSGSGITEKGIEMYAKVTAVSFDDIEPTGVIASDALALFHELQTALDTLRLENTEPTDGKQVWDALVRVNTLARELRTSLTPAPVPKPESGGPLETSAPERSLSVEKPLIEKPVVAKSFWKRTG